MKLHHPHLAAIAAIAVHLHVKCGLQPKSTAKTLQEWDIFPEIGEAIQRAGSHWHWWIFGPWVTEVGSDGTDQELQLSGANCLLLTTEHEASIVSIVTMLVVKNAKKSKAPGLSQI